MRTKDGKNSINVFRGIGYKACISSMIILLIAGVLFGAPAFAQLTTSSSSSGGSSC